MRVFVFPVFLVTSLTLWKTLSRTLVASLPSGLKVDEPYHCLMSALAAAFGSDWMMALYRALPLVGVLSRIAPVVEDDGALYVILVPAGILYFVAMLFGISNDTPRLDGGLNVGRSE